MQTGSLPLQPTKWTQDILSFSQRTALKKGLHFFLFFFGREVIGDCKTLDLVRRMHLSCQTWLHHLSVKSEKAQTRPHEQDTVWGWKVSPSEFCFVVKQSEVDWRDINGDGWYNYRYSPDGDYVSPHPILSPFNLGDLSIWALGQRVFMRSWRSCPGRVGHIQRIQAIEKEAKVPPSNVPPNKSPRHEWTNENPVKQDLSFPEFSRGSYCFRELENWMDELARLNSCNVWLPDSHRIGP